MTNHACSRCGNRSRRAFLADLGHGFTGLALGAMLARDGVVRANETTAWLPPDGKPHFAPKAKSVVWLFMNGGVSHLESFDPKPVLNKYADKILTTETPYADLPNAYKVNKKAGAQFDPNFKIIPLQFGFRKHGESGIELSDCVPHVASCIDDIAVIRSMWTSNDNHGAQTEFHTGRHIFQGDFPTLGAWVDYGLGSINENLPQFISMGKREYWNAKDGDYLGPAHDAIPIRIDPQNPLDFGKPASGQSVAEEQLGFDLVGRLNQLKGVEYPNDPSLNARIKAYELAFRMQTSIPEVLGFETETKETQELYGLDDPASKAFGSQMLATRRLIERGVRFIQVQHGANVAGDWDAHSALKQNHEMNFKQVDKPIAGLLKDLKRRGLLDSTIVVFGTEFGRSPSALRPGGREHHPYGFSVWMAGGGIKGGVVHGATDEIGFHAIEHRHYVTDIHATILKQLGLDSRKLEVPGRKRLDIDHGNPINEIIV